ncbi:hypothetical protein BU26DRAFT_516740 [Trematosphaeria pertusa]|uniref:Uncharacterized protein n=1 Tax=Trematosphaeria pertusa TaxID=390896 RepID=A0A6A6IR19_9PLEO|nr:uncharacterized protein BU26DRAFT_516740 [Trematosphaeria pertusa]KAF2252030.1 hypothetical protein BU26DRAFT_516740 [Trematosphaeria pertusa]
MRWRFPSACVTASPGFAQVGSRLAQTCGARTVKSASHKRRLGTIQHVGSEAPSQVQRRGLERLLADLQCLMKCIKDSEWESNGRSFLAAVTAGAVCGTDKAKENMLLFMLQSRREAVMPELAGSIERSGEVANMGVRSLRVAVHDPCALCWGRSSAMPGKCGWRT